MHLRIGSGDRYVGEYLPGKHPLGALIGGCSGFPFIILSGEYISSFSFTFTSLKESWNEEKWSKHSLIGQRLKTESAGTPGPKTRVFTPRRGRFQIKKTTTTKLKNNINYFSFTASPFSLFFIRLFWINLIPDNWLNPFAKTVHHIKPLNSEVFHILIPKMNYSGWNRGSSGSVRETSAESETLISRFRRRKTREFLMCKIIKLNSIESVGGMKRCWVFHCLRTTMRMGGLTFRHQGAEKWKSDFVFCDHVTGRERLRLSSFRCHRVFRNYPSYGVAALERKRSNRQFPVRGDNGRHLRRRRHGTFPRACRMPYFS